MNIKGIAITLLLLFIVSTAYITEQKFDLREQAHVITKLESDTVNMLKIIKANSRDIERIQRVQAIQDVRKITVTAYTPSVDETDSDPYTTASMKRIRAGSVAVSRDLFKGGWVFGKKVYIEGIGIFEILDLMHNRWENRIDIVIFSKEEARKFGKKSDLTAALLGL